MLCHGGVRLYRVVVHVVRGPVRDAPIHAVLRVQQTYNVAEPSILDDALKQCDAEAALLGLGALNGGRQLTVVPWR
jgi:hypothetical protein